MTNSNSDSPGSPDQSQPSASSPTSSKNWTGPLLVVGILVGIATAIWLSNRETPPATDDKAPTTDQQDHGQDVLKQGKDAPVAVVTGDTKRRTTQRVELMDPRNDGWDTEAIAELANRQLKKVSGYFKHPGEEDAKKLATVAASDFSSGPLWPAELTSVYHTDAFDVQRAADEASPSSKETKLAGAADFINSITTAPILAKGITDTYAKFKVFKVEVAADSTTTEVYFEANGKSQDGAVQQNATWLCRWIPTSDKTSLQLQSVEVSDFEEVRFTPGRPGTLLADCTAAVFANEPIFAEQLQQSIHHWAGRIERHLGSDNRALQGIAIGDVNGDGRDDIYLCQPKGLPNRLLVQSPDGSVRDAAASAGVDWLDSTTSALFVDIDGDGDQDLVLASQSGLLFMSNDGQGKFSQEARFKGGKSDSLAASDYDLDGDLDFYVCRYSNEEGSGNMFPVPLPYHDANNGPGNKLYRNDGDWKFKDVTDKVGLGENNRRFSWAATWEDLDNDGDPDLYVANDFGRNNFYRNDEGHFTDVAATAGIEDRSTGMATAIGDYNRDGLMDVYVSNMWSSAGNRITYQRQFKDNVDNQTKNSFQYLARGNSLFENRGDGTFRDVSIDAGVTMGRWSWASLFCDIDNDGWQDLLVANGMITGERPGDL